MRRLSDPGPWTEAEFLALGETEDRIELVDGDLRVSPSPTGPHQVILHYMFACLDDPALEAGLAAFPDVDVRLGPGRILTPDIMVGKWRWEPGIADATEVVLVGEVTSPSNAAFDRKEKMGLYAAAGIEWYLLAEPDLPAYRTVTLVLHRLEDGRYVRHAVAEPGQILTSDRPFPFTIPTARLIRHQGRR
jgi:Uma2 family endonuclease